MSFLAGHMPHLPPPPKSEPRGSSSPAHAGDEPLRPGERDLTGKVGTAGCLVARRPADCDPKRGRRWWFECLLCARWVRREPWRVYGDGKNTGHVNTCGCGPRGGIAPQRLASMGRAA